MASTVGVALITGADLPIGSQRAYQFASQGMSTALHYEFSASESQVRAIAYDLCTRYPSINVTVHTGDLSTATAIEALLSEVALQHGRIDVVINTAGLALSQPATEAAGVGYHKMFAYMIFVDEQRRRTMDLFQTELQG